MKNKLLAPKGKLTVDAILDVVALAGVDWVSRAALESLTDAELGLVYDWAMREHVHASDDRIERRPRPSCLELGAVVSSLMEIASGGASDSMILSQFRERISDLDLKLKGLSPAPRSADSADSIDRQTADVCVVPEYRIALEFSLRMPPGSSQPTPTREAVEAAALTMAGPPFEILSNYTVRVGPAEFTGELWEALAPLSRIRGNPRGRVFRSLMAAGVVTLEALKNRGIAGLRLIPGLGDASLRALARARLLGDESTTARLTRRRRRAVRGRASGGRR